MRGLHGSVIVLALVASQAQAIFLDAGVVDQYISTLKPGAATEQQVVERLGEPGDRRQRDGEYDLVYDNSEERAQVHYNCLLTFDARGTYVVGSCTIYNT